MKGQSKRFVNHKGNAYKMGAEKKNVDDANVGFFSLWRYADTAERAATLAGVALGWCASFGLIAAVVIYGEITSLFVQRHRAAATTPHAHILSLFGGGTQLPAGNRTLHMNALMDDSIAFGLASVVIIIIQFLSAALAVTVANWAAARMVARVRRRLLRAVLSQEVAYFDTNTTMNFASTLTEDTEKIRAGVGEHVVMTSYLGGSVVLATVLSLTYGWQLTLAGVSVVPIAIILSSIVAKYQTRCTTKEVVAYGTAGRIVEEVLSAIRTVRAYAGEEIEVQRFQAALGAGGAWARRRAAWAGAGAGAGWLLTYALNAIVFAYGAALCVRDMELPPHQQHYHPGVMLTILFCTFMASQNIVMCQPHLEIFSAARGAAKSLFKIMERKSNIDAMQDKGTKPDKFSGEIVFDNLYFNYPSRPDVKVLRGLTLKVKPGETVALVGSSGCGKSTLLHLLQRMYEPDSGSISVDGHKLEDLNLHHFRTSIGVVGQEPVLFSGTIRENITLGMPDATEEEVIAAAKTANAHHFITKLANGYSTEIGARGASLSGGQKQRVAIARALLRRPALLLLDEPTSALDPTSERQVQAALDAASKGRTTLVVSHRLSTIENASRIVYVEQGAVLEQGSHDELLEKRGAYWRLLQDDLSTRNIASTLSESTADDDQVEDGLGDGSPPARGARVGRTGSAASRHRESFARSSIRLGAVSAAHIQPALDLTPYEEEDEPCKDDEDTPSVSTWSLMKLNAPEWPLLLGGGVASVLVGASMPVFALLLSRLYGMFASSDADLILSQSRLYAGLFALVAAVCGLVMFLQTWLFNKAGIALTDRLRVMSFRNFLYQEQGWFDSAQNSVGALCARLASDCAAVQGATGTRLGTVLQGVSTMCIGVTLAMAYSWKMTLVSLLSVPCVIGGIYLEGYITKQSQERERKALELASRAATEAVLNVRTVQSLGVEETLISRYASALRGAAGGAGKSAALRGAVYGLCLCAPTLGYAVALAYGGALIANDELHYEYAILVAEALIYGAWMLAEALSFAPNFAAARRSGARILVALRRQTNIRDEPTATHDPDWIANGSLEFDNVHFRYPTRPGVAVLRGLTLKLQAGNTLALVGGSGCGKSTLMHLLMRNYDADSGSVKLDGRDVKTDLTLKSLRAQLGLVQQEPVVFERTIMENIAYGDNSREVGIDEVIEAAKQANIHTFIAGLPMGYGTRLEAGGGALSGGQKQRVATARALLRRPRLLLLDEATSALDAAGERSVQAALEAAARGRSTVIIAHRLATVRHAHTIALIDKGVVAESGTHDELVRKRGLYWELLQQQSPHEAIA